MNSAAADGLFEIDENSEKLSDAEQEKFHKIVAKGLFLSKRARPDVQPVIAFLCTRVKCPTEQDKEKLHRMMSFLWWTKDECLTLEMDDSGIIEWHVDASFAVHHAPIFEFDSCYRTDMRY